MHSVAIGVLDSISLLHTRQSNTREGLLRSSSGAGEKDANGVGKSYFSPGPITRDAMQTNTQVGLLFVIGAELCNFVIF